MEVRGKFLRIEKHALHGMNAERPVISPEDLVEVLHAPDRDEAGRCTRRLGRRTLLVYYEENELEVIVRGVSATRTRLPA